MTLNERFNKDLAKLELEHPELIKVKRYLIFQVWAAGYGSHLDHVADGMKGRKEDNAG